MIHIAEFIKYFQQQSKPPAVSTTFVKIICANTWHTRGAGQPKVILIGSGSPRAAATMLSSAFCISGLTGLSQPMCLLEPEQVPYKPCPPCLGFPWARFIQMEDEFFPGKMKPISSLQCNEGPVPPWPLCKGSPILPSWAVGQILLSESLSPHPSSATHPSLG